MLSPNLKRKILKIVWPISKWIGKQHFPFTHKKITGRDYFDLKDKLERGMVLLTKTRGQMTNWFIPSYWTHSALYLGKGLVVEAVADGVVATDLVTFMTSKDYIAVYESKTFSDYEKLMAAMWAMDKIGRPYDYFFQSKDEAFYCIELIIEAYKSVNRNVLLKEQEEILIPDLITNEDKWSRVWTSEK